MHQSAPHHCRALLPRASSPLHPCSAITKRLRLPLPLPLTPSGSPSPLSLQPRACARASARQPWPSRTNSIATAAPSPAALQRHHRVRLRLRDRLPNCATLLHRRSPLARRYSGAATAWLPAHVARRPWAVAGHGKTFYRCALPPRLHSASPLPQTSSTAVGTGWSPTCSALEEEEGPRATIG